VSSLIFNLIMGIPRHCKKKAPGLILWLSNFGVSEGGTKTAFFFCLIVINLVFIDCFQKCKLSLCAWRNFPQVKCLAMKISILFRAKKHGSLNKIILLVLLMIAIVVVFLEVTWSFQIFESEWGTRLAQAVIAYHIVLLLGMGAVGIGLGHWVDRMIRQKRSIFRSPQKGSWTEAFMNLWGYELKSKEETAPGIDTIPTPASGTIEPFVLLDLPTRRGRKPTFTLERWLPIALKWENRDPVRDAFTLAELISEHLGTNSDGSPIVSEQTYYSVWRKRAMDEIRKRAKSRKSPSVRES